MAKNMMNIDDLSYNAKENPEWFIRAHFGGRLIRGGYVVPVTGIKGDETLGMIATTSKILQKDGKDCAWTPNQILKLSEKDVLVKTYKINLEQCLDDLERKRTIYELSPGAENTQLPEKLEEAALQLIGNDVSNEIEEMIVGGDSTARPDDADGIVKILTDSETSIQLAGTAFTTANLADQVAKLYNALPERVLQNEQNGAVQIFCLISYSTRRMLRQIMATLPSDVLAAMWTVDDSDKKNPRLFYLDMEFVPVKGIDNNTMVAYAYGNVMYLTDLESDFENIELGAFPKPNDNKVYIKGRLRLGTNVLFDDEAVILSSAISEDRLPVEDINIVE